MNDKEKIELQELAREICEKIDNITDMLKKYREENFDNE